MGLLKKIFKGKKNKNDKNSNNNNNESTMGCTQSKSSEAVPATARAATTSNPSSSSNKPSTPPPLHPTSNTSNSMDSAPRLASKGQSNHSAGGFSSYASGASTPEFHSDEDDGGGNSSDHSNASQHKRSSYKSTNSLSNPKLLQHSTSAIGLDEMMEDRRTDGDLRQNVVHIEVPFGKPIEEVYEGVHSGPVLGSGISGLVRLVTHKATGIKYAVKVLDLGLVDTSEGLRQLREEIFIMCQLDHPNIVRLEEVYESQSEIYLVQELCLGGELFDRLDEQPDYHYTEAECARLVKQMLSAVRYLHSRGIIHRDLKLENFLFSSTSQDSELKMIDFGLSKHFRYGEVQHEAVGTPYTVAPEVIRGSYDERCDIWAIGVISFLLLSGDPPFGGCGGPEPLMTVRSNILRGSFSFEPEDIWANVSTLARTFISDMLKTDPKDRPTARKAQQHQWLQEWASRSRKGKDNILNPNVVKALVNFKEFSDMRKLLCEVLSFTLLPYQIKELRREFEKMDTDGSGEISLSALKQVLVTNAGTGSLGALTEPEVEDIFNAMRVRKTETRIHWHEFIAAGLSQCKVDDRNLRLAFDRLDGDHKGYIILEDIMDLMGSDALQSETEMRQMWGDSIKAVQSKHARITYDDFLLLMKGQSKEAPSQELERELENSVSNLVGVARLHIVPEANTSYDESPKSSAKSPTMITLPSGDIVGMDGKIQLKADGSSKQALKDKFLDPAFSNSQTTIQSTQSAPCTPADHKRILDIDGLNIDSPLSMDADDDIVNSGPGVPGCSVSLTPPHSPSRGPNDYVTPCGERRTFMDFEDLKKNGLELPGLPSGVSTPALGMMSSKVQPKRRSRSMDEAEESPGREEKAKQLQEVADVVRDMLLPEADHVHPASGLGEILNDDSKSTLVVNRKLYRAHRQMRMAVLEASKRFEEQQAEHAKEVILAAREDDVDDTGAVASAGLVMRHGNKKQVSSKAIASLLASNREQQQSLVEKANRRGGRGRRSRKKTISDMSGMMTSMGQDDLGAIAQKAAALDDKMYEDLTPAPVIDQMKEDGPMADLSESGNLRAPTVPGEFRETSDPFGERGKYGLLPWK